MKKLETSITRDLSLIDIAAWFDGYQRGIPAWIPWGFTDTVFYVHEGRTEILRPEQEYAVGFRDVVLKRIADEPRWLPREIVTFNARMEAASAFYDASSSSIPNADATTLLSIYDQYRATISDAIGPFITVYGVPNWLADAPDHAALIASCMAARTNAEPLFPRGAELTNALLRELEGRANLSAEQLRLISPDEFSVFLQDGLRPDEAGLRARSSGCVYSKAGITLMQGEVDEIATSFKQLGYDFTPAVQADVHEFKGQVACRGNVTGIVRVILSKKDIPLLERGEILVTAMTTPEYVPAMERSAAIITDEGGVTCHAAIVAREMEKPCIIGTNIATKALRTGDTVEVDAEKGIVRILHSAT